jgi:hypothetical protein
MSLHDLDPCGIELTRLPRGKFRLAALERWHDGQGEESYIDLTPNQAKALARMLLGQTKVKTLIVAPWFDGPMCAQSEFGELTPAPDDGE